jgi:hypothetical protein
MKDEALKLALEALEESETNNDTMEFWDRKTKAITAIKQALAAQPAPAAFEVSIVEWVGNKLMATPKNAQEFTCSTGLCHYKAQRQWVGLTDEDYHTNMFSITSLGACDIATIKSIAKDVEAKLKEKNT